MGRLPGVDRMAILRPRSSPRAPLTAWRCLVLLATSSLLWALPSLGHADSIAVIVNKGNPLRVVDQSTLASMYRGEELHWPHGGRIKLVNREIASPLRERFYRLVLNAKPDQKFYRPGTPVAVHSLIQRSDQAVLRFVAAIPGAIGYIRLSNVNESVKVVLIIPDP